jgi:hypothetical protein
MENSTKFASNSLAIVAKILGLLSNFDTPIHQRRLLRFGGEFSKWVSPGDRRLLEETNMTAYVTVAKGGSGDYKTIILDKWNVMMFGDGQAKTIVSSNLNFVDSTPTFNTVTFSFSCSLCFLRRKKKIVKEQLSGVDFYVSSSPAWCNSLSFSVFAFLPCSVFCLLLSTSLLPTLLSFFFLRPNIAFSLSVSPFMAFRAPFSFLVFVLFGSREN